MGMIAMLEDAVDVQEPSAWLRENTQCPECSNGFTVVQWRERHWRDSDGAPVHVRCCAECRARRDHDERVARQRFDEASVMIGSVDFGPTIREVLSMSRHMSDVRDAVARFARAMDWSAGAVAGAVDRITGSPPEASLRVLADPECRALITRIALHKLGMTHVPTGQDRASRLVRHEVRAESSRVVVSWRDLIDVAFTRELVGYHVQPGIVVGADGWTGWALMMRDYARMFAQSHTYEEGAYCPECDRHNAATTLPIEWEGGS